MGKTQKLGVVFLQFALSLMITNSRNVRVYGHGGNALPR
jgi:hypothetical protein